MLEEWEGYMFSNWLMEHWAPITTTSQPYYASRDDIALTAENPADGFPMLQLPGNAVMVDYLVTSEHRDVFEENWPGGPLDEPTVFHGGLHPTNFANYYLQILDGFLFASVDEAMYDQDLGPAVYATAKDLIPIFPQE